MPKSRPKYHGIIPICILIFVAKSWTSVAPCGALTFRVRDVRTPLLSALLSPPRAIRGTRPTWVLHALSTSTSNWPRPISFLPPSPPNRGHLSASTPSPSGLAPVYKSSLRRVSTDTDTDRLRFLFIFDAGDGNSPLYYYTWDVRSPRVPRARTSQDRRAGNDSSPLNLVGRCAV